MSHNPYTPPQAQVADVAVPPMPRPRSVTVAVCLFWIVLVIGTVNLLPELDPSKIAMGIVVPFIMVAGSVVLIVMIWRGRNWARMTALLGTVFFMITVGVVMNLGGATLDAAFVSALVINAVALVIIFGPGRRLVRRPE